MDLRKAFDTVSHTILIQKLKKLGLTKQTLSWYHSFLVDKTQRTLVNGSLSEEGRMPLGVPQGSVIGPLLFILYVNGIFEEIENTRMFMYADHLAIM